MLSLNTVIKVGCGTLEYRFEPRSNLPHKVIWHSGCTREFKATMHKLPGEAINVVAPYRDESPDVAELVSWLASQATLPRYGG